MLQKSNGLINWVDSAVAIERRIRGLQPWPNAFTEHAARRLIIWNGEPVKTGRAGAIPGEVVMAHGDDLVVQCGAETALRLIAVQAEGARRLSARDFMNGSHIHVGDKLGISE
jgi:methionyl-tRNA formyltransferase